MRRPVLGNAHNIRHEVLAVRIDGNDALVAGKMLLNIGKGGLHRGALAAIDLVVQYRYVMLQFVKNGLPVRRAAIVNNDQGIRRLLPEFRYRFKQLLIRLIGGNDNNHETWFLRICPVACARRAFRQHSNAMILYRICQNWERGGHGFPPASL